MVRASGVRPLTATLVLSNSLSTILPTSFSTIPSTLFSTMLPMFPFTILLTLLSKSL